jgi:thioredoxin 2
MTAQDAPAEIACPHCLAVNRVPESRLADGPRCGRCSKPLFAGEPMTLRGEDFERLIAHTAVPVLLDCWAPWCAPCRQFAPVFADAARRLEPGLRFAKLDTEAQQALAQRLGIRSIPTLILFREGQELTRMSGAMAMPQLLQWLHQSLHGND